MICTYCRAHNEADDHRCCRCGRRLSATPVMRGSAVPQLDPRSVPEVAPPRPGLQIVPPPEAPRPPDRSEPGVQASLFGPVEVGRQAQSKAQARPAAQRPRRQKIEHPTLDFAAHSAHTLKTSVEASIYCNSRVAPAAYRAMAAIIDSGIGILGTLIFVLTFQLSGYPVEWNRATVWTLVASVILISLLYRTLFCLGNGDTIGLRATRLRLVNFDGRPADRGERFRRLASGLMSTGAIGLGLLWALVEEEHLTWHDSISKTFPTLT